MGDVFFIYGSGFASGEDVLLEWNYTTTTGTQTWSQTVKANAEGAISASVPIPALTSAPVVYAVRASMGGKVVATAPIFIRKP